MALDGYCLNLDLPQLRRMSYLLQNCSNNLNQVAKRVNESNQLYAADIEDLRHRMDEQYLQLDELCNELESVRYQAMYLAGAADFEKLFRQS